MFDKVIKQVKREFNFNLDLPTLDSILVLNFLALLKFTGFQLGTFAEKDFEEKAVAKSRRIVKEARRENDTISRCKGALAAVVAQAGSITERGMIKSFKVREHLSCPIAISIGNTKF